MKIKKLEIINFGGIKNKTFNFEENFNFIKEKNEFGKSTIIEVIRVIFYGFHKIKNYDYLPFDGSKIEIKGYFEDFSIERNHFGERTSSKIDFFKIGKSFALANNSIFKFLRDEKNNLDKDILNIFNRYFEAGVEDFSSDIFIINSDILDEKRKFLKNAKKNELSFYDSFDYKGLLFEDLYQKLEEEKKKIYTNNINSNSKIKYNERKIN